jgi:hypothetical protein
MNESFVVSLLSRLSTGEVRGF